MRLRPFRVPPPSAAAWWAHRGTTHEGAPLPNHDADEVVVPASRDAFERARDALLRYDVYPASILAHRVCTGDGRVAKGALIVQRAKLGPVAVEAGVRAADAWDEPDRAGFRYVTLRGHPERGIATFSLAHEGERATFRIESDSGPAAWETRLRSGQARRLQRRAVAGALARMRNRLEGAP